MDDLVVAITGTDPDTCCLLFDVLKRGMQHQPWIVWDATVEPAPPSIGARATVTYRAHAYAAECQILSTLRIMDNANVDRVWIVDADVVTAATLLGGLPACDPEADVVLGGAGGVSRFSRKAVQRIARDFGTGVDYTGLGVQVLDGGCK